MSRLHIPQSVSSERKEFNPVLDRLFKNAGLQTPAQPNQDQQWEEMDQFYQSIGQGLITVGQEVNSSVQLLRNLGITENAEVAVTVNGLNRDLQQFTEDLLAIRKRHDGLVGKVKDGDELALCLSIFNDYVILNDRFRAVVFPAMLTMTEHVTEAVARARKASDLIDPNVITDVEVIEKPVQTEPSSEGNPDVK